MDTFLSPNNGRQPRDAEFFTSFYFFLSNVYFFCSKIALFNTFLPFLCQKLFYFLPYLERFMCHYEGGFLKLRYFFIFVTQTKRSRIPRDSNFLIF